MNPCKVIIALVLSSILVTASVSAQERRDDFYWLSEINKASTVMVVEQGIVPRTLGKTIADAVAQVIANASQARRPPPGDYLEVEPLIIAIGGPDVTRMHSGPQPAGHRCDAQSPVPARPGVVTYARAQHGAGDAPRFRRQAP